MKNLTQDLSGNLGPPRRGVNVQEMKTLEPDANDLNPIFIDGLRIFMADGLVNQNSSKGNIPLLFKYYKGTLISVSVYAQYLYANIQRHI